MHPDSLESVFGRDMRVDENTARPANVRAGRPYAGECAAAGRNAYRATLPVSVSLTT